MGTQRVTKIIDHIQRETPTGKIILTCIEDLILDIGLYGPWWDMPFKLYSKYVQKHSWVFACIKYIHDNNIQLSIIHNYLQAGRSGDQPIMLLASHLITKNGDLRAINRVRIALNLVNLSDICSANGRSLDKRFQ